MQDTPDWRSAPRNVFSTEFKLRMVELAQLPGANIAAIAREHGFNHNLLYERIPVCKASVILTLTSSCSSVSGLIAARAAGYYEIR